MTGASGRRAAAMTSSNSQGSNCADPASIIDALWRFSKGPRQIGHLCGFTVYIDDSLPPGRIELRQPGGQVIGFSVDHPYIQGTKLEAAARHALRDETAADRPRETLASDLAGGQDDIKPGSFDSGARS